MAIHQASADLGVTIERELGQGDDGTAYLLTNGRVLRKTHSRQEIAIAQALMQQSAPHPAFPTIYGVWRQLSFIEYNGQRFDTVNLYLIRDEMAHVPIEQFGIDIDDWKAALRTLNHGWNRDDAQCLALAAKQHETIGQIYEALMWAREALGVKIADIGRISNTGWINGRIGIRDFSRAVVPDSMLDAVNAGQFPSLPHFTPINDESDQDTGAGMTLAPD